MTKKRILAISPHVDDVEFGCGGTLRKWASDGHEIFYVAMSDCRDTLIKTHYPENTLQLECQRALNILGVPKKHIFILAHTNKHYYREARAIFEDLEKLRDKLKPDLVLIPTIANTHQDHETVAKQATSVFRRSTSIVAYEQPWNTIDFTPNFFVSLTSKDVTGKLAALKQYKTQAYFRRSYLNPDAIMGWARMRGMHIDAQYAEAFRAVKLMD